MLIVYPCLQLLIQLYNLKISNFAKLILQHN